MNVRAPRRVVRRRNRPSPAPRPIDGGLGAAVPARPAIAALTVVLIGTGLRTVAIADGEADYPLDPRQQADRQATADARFVDGQSIVSLFPDATPGAERSSLVGTGDVVAAGTVLPDARAVDKMRWNAARVDVAQTDGDRLDVVPKIASGNDELEPTAMTGGGAAADGEGVPSGFRRRPYVALGIGASRLEPESPSIALTVDEDTSFAGELGIGYDITRWLSAELHVADLGAAGIDFLGSDVGDLDYLVFGASAVFYLFNARDGVVPFTNGLDGAHLREGFSVFGRFGIGGLRNDSDRVSFRRDHASHAVFGAGLEYGFSNGIALRAELQAFDTDARYLGVSVLKRFGRARAAVPLAAALPVEPSPPPVAPAADPAPLPAPELPIVHFDFDRADLRDESLARLDAFVEAVEDDERSIAIDGHTDWKGLELYNDGLSDRRAEAVRDYLVSRGIAATRIETAGYGENRPVTLDRSAEGRALNRRAEIRLD